jgi:hypothetical protein
MMIRRLILFFAPLAIIAGKCFADLYPAASVRNVQIGAMQKCCFLANNASNSSGANMRYLLKTIDICNKGRTNYGAGAHATDSWANTNAVSSVFGILLDHSTGEPYLEFPKNRQFNFTMDWGPGYKIEVKFKLNVTTAGANVVFYNNCYSRFGFMGESTYWRADYLNNEMKQLVTSRDTNVHVIVKQDRNNWIDGVLYQNNNTGQTPAMTNCPITIGAHGNSDVTYGMEGRIYYVKIWDGNGVLLKHLVPMPSGGTLASNAALYDIISDTVIYSNLNNNSQITIGGCI